MNEPGLRAGRQQPGKVRRLRMAIARPLMTTVRRARMLTWLGPRSRCMAGRLLYNQTACHDNHTRAIVVLFFSGSSRPDATCLPRANVRRFRLPRCCRVQGAGLFCWHPLSIPIEMPTKVREGGATERQHRIGAGCESHNMIACNNSERAWCVEGGGRAVGLSCF